MIYLIGSLRNTRIPEIAATLRSRGYAVYDDWFAAGPEADDIWKAYEQGRGRNLPQALAAPHAQAVYEMDKKFLDGASVGVVVMPAGKSAHLEAGYLTGLGRPVYVLMEPEDARWDIMLKFLAGVYYDLDVLIDTLKVRGQG